MLPEENPRPPEHINNPPGNPLLEFCQLLAGISVMLVAFVAVTALAASYLAPYIPYRWEPTAFHDLETPEEFQSAQTELQALVDELAVAMSVPAKMHVQVHLIDGEPNAFASLGGQILVTAAALQGLTSENGLAMVLAHEIAHLKRRHPIAGVGRGVVISVVLNAVFGASASGSAAALIGQTGGRLTEFSFSRSMERRADRDALAAVVARYGHSRGAYEFFQNMLGKRAEASWQLMFSTHPMTEQRIAAIRAQEELNRGRDLVPLSAAISALVNSDSGHGPVLE